MNPSRPFILRPVATSLLAAAIVLIGLFTYRLLPVSALPEIDFPVIQVVTLYPGASPAVVGATVTAPLAHQFGQMPGLSQLSSTSSAGTSAITLRFDLQLPLDVAEQEVQAAISAASPVLPKHLSQPPVYRKVNPADAPILTLALTSPTLPLREIRQLADTRLVPKLSQVTGVGQVSLNGGHRPAIVVQADPAALAAGNLSLADLRRAIVAANPDRAKGGFEGPLQSSTIAANDQLDSAADFGDLVVTYHDGAAVRLRDVATVAEGAENARFAAWSGTTPAIIVSIRRQPGANVVAVADRVRGLLPNLQASLPAAVDVAILSDHTEAVRASVRDVQFELLFAIALVVLVIFLFLRNGIATVIPSLVIPLSLIGTFAVMYVAGFSVNGLTLMALIIATGFMVDDAIVMIENIARHVEAGESSLEAALHGAREIAFTVVSLTVSLVAVLIPLLFMGGVVGRMFREFALTLATAILISGAVTLTLTPMLCARLLHRIPEAQQSAFARRGGQWFARLTARYERGLEWVLARQRATLLVVLGSIALTVLLYVVIPKGLFPVQDTGEIQGISVAAPSVSFATMSERQEALTRILSRDPAVANVSSFIGVDGANPTLNTGRLLIELKPLSARRRVGAVLRRLRAAVAGVAGVKLYLQPVPDLTIEDQVSPGRYQFALIGPDQDALRAWVPQLVRRLSRRTRLTDVVSNQQDGGLEAYVQVDPRRAARHGITPAAVNDALYNAFGQRQVATLLTSVAQRRVILEIKPDFHSVQAAIGSIYLEGRSDATTADKPAAGVGKTLVPLAAISRVSERAAPLSLTRIDQLPAATISFNLPPGVALGSAVRAVERIQHRLGMPADLQLRWQGAARAFQTSLGGQALLILATLITVYIVLGVLYENYIHPLTILSTLPSAGIGALLALILGGFELDVISIIGIILLIGIVQKNAIMMIDFALVAQREQGLAPRDAIVQACRLRFRPILMTTLAALVGALPLMFGWGMGSELRHPLGVAVVGGLLVSQVLTLFTTPVIYLAFERVARRGWRRSLVAWLGRS